MEGIGSFDTHKCWKLACNSMILHWILVGRVGPSYEVLLEYSLRFFVTHALGFPSTKQ